MGTATLLRVYSDSRPRRPAFLVERLWPRGIRRADLPMDGWVKDAAPSTELRRWFGHDPAKWEEFARLYRAELDANPDGWRPLADALDAGDVTLLYSSRDEQHNNAIVLRDYLVAHAKGRT